MVTGCFKMSLYAGFAISVFNYATDILAVIEWKDAVDGYESLGSKISKAVSSDEFSNFKADSEWFTNLLSEYDSLSDFDKENVYCDVSTIQASPSELLTDSKYLLWTVVIFGAAASVGFMVAYCALCCLCMNDWAHNETHKGLDKTPPEANRTREKLFYFRAKCLILFCESGPFMALIWIMITRIGQLNGFACQEAFYYCGVDGDCTLEDLMVPVALNSSIFDLMTDDVILALALGSGMLDLLISFMFTEFFFLREGDGCFLLYPFLQASLALLPLAWVLFIDDLVPLGTLPGVLISAHIPIIIIVVWLIIDCRRRREEREFNESADFRKKANARIMSSSVSRPERPRIMSASLPSSVPSLPRNTNSRIQLGQLRA